jgi:hypothetical protein
MARTKENVHADKAHKPIGRNGAVYTYMSRTSNCPPAGSSERPMMSPSSGAPAYFPYAYYYNYHHDPMHSAHAYYYPEDHHHYYHAPGTYHGREYSHHPQQKPATSHTQYYYEPQHPAAYYYEPHQPVYYYHSPWHSYEYMPAEPVYHHHQPKSEAKSRTLPWYGRTAQEVQDDQWKERKHYEREVRRAEAVKSDGGVSNEREVEAKSIEPQGKPSDQYWVVHKEGGMRAYPLGTIKHNFEGTWKVDERGWPYLLEK